MLFRRLFSICLLFLSCVILASPINGPSSPITITAAPTLCNNGTVEKTFTGGCPGVWAEGALTGGSVSGLISITDFSYAGGFRIPAGEYGGTNMSSLYSFGPMGYNPDNSSVYIVGHDNTRPLAEFTIPAIVNSATLSDLNVAAAPIQGYVQPLSLASGFNEPGVSERVGGIYYDAGRMMITGFPFYGQSPSSTQFLLFADADDIANSANSGWIESASGASASAAAGFISKIPAEWQAALGGTHLSGLSTSTHRAYNAGASIGPAAYAFDADTALDNYSTISNIPTVELIKYTLANSLSPGNDYYNTSGTNDIWTHISETSFGFIVPGTDTYAVFGRSGGHGPLGAAYGTDNCGFQGHCALDSSDYYPFYWLYDVNDMAAVRAGTMQSYEIQPYEYGPINTSIIPFQTYSNRGVIGGAFDDATSSLYLMLVREDGLQAASEAPVIIKLTIGV